MDFSDPTLIAFDTSGPHIASAILLGDDVVAERFIERDRGQGEDLMPQLEALLVEAGLGWKDLTALAVGIGPGNFTGTRIAVAAARGLALGLGIPAVGVSNFELLLEPVGNLSDPALILSLAAPRGRTYVQRFHHGLAQGAPRLIDPVSPPTDLELSVNMRVEGHRAEEIAAPFHVEWAERAPQDIGPRVARRAQWLLSRADVPPPRPAPLYVRPADAAPSRDAPPVILDAI